MPSLSRNTMALTLRTAVSIAIGLVTSRLVLQALGVEGYGLYAVLGALVALIDFVNASMAGASSRFMAYELGRGGEGSARSVVGASLRIHLGLTIMLLCVAETAGLWYVRTRLSVGDENAATVAFVYQAVVLTAAASVMKTPAVSWLMARERMRTYAWLEIGSALLRLAVVVGLVYGLAGGDICGYSAMIAGVAVVTMIAFWLCLLGDLPPRQYAEGQVEAPTRKMIRFSALDLVGNMSVIFHAQGIALVLNATIGLSVNAALSLANAVQTALLTLVSSISVAVRPRMIKLYAAGCGAELFALLKKSIFVAGLAYSALAIPLIFNAEYVLRLWLGSVPEATAQILSVLVVANLFAVWTAIFNAVIHASGRIAALSFGTGAIYLLAPVAVYALSSAGYDAAKSLAVLGVLYPAIMIVSMSLASRSLPKRSLQCILAGAMLPVLAVSAVATLLCLAVNSLAEGGLLRLVSDSLLSAALFGSIFLILKNRKKI